MAIAQNFPTISPSLLLDFANVEALDPRITFTRATTATYYGTRTALAEQNLLLQSQTFETTWIKPNTTITSNSTVAPDGTTTADTMTGDAVTGVKAIYQNLASNNGAVFSVFAKKGTNNFIQLLTNQEANGFANFDLDAGTVNATTLTGAITLIGSGWYRCSVVIPSGVAFTQPYITLVTSASATRYESNTLTTTVFLWGAQLEQRSSVTAYTVTTTQPITNYVPVLETAASGVARFDHNPTTFESLGLLIEQQSTNLFTYSEQFDNAAWTKSNATVTANTIVSPDGTLDADKLVEGTTTARKYALQTGAASGRTFSVYAKAGGRNFISIGSTNGGGLWGVSQFNLSTGVFVNAVSVGGEAAPTSPTITSVGNGWYRVSVLLAGSSTSAVIMVTNGGDPVFEGYTGNGFDGIFIWGAQLEAGSFATSYIPTVASQVTRAADAASMTGTNFSSWYNAAQGTLYADAVLNGNAAASNHRLIWISNNTTQNFIAFDETGTTNYRFLIQASNTSQAALNLTVANTAQPNKLIGAYKVNDFAASANAGTVGTDTSGDIPMVDRIDFGSGVSTTHINGTIKKFSYYPIALTSTQLQALTS